MNILIVVLCLAGIGLAFVGWGNQGNKIQMNGGFALIGVSALLGIIHLILKVI